MNQRAYQKGQEILNQYKEKCEEAGVNFYCIDNE